MDHNCTCYQCDGCECSNACSQINTRARSRKNVKNLELNKNNNNNHDRRANICNQRKLSKIHKISSYSSTTTLNSGRLIPSNVPNISSIKTPFGTSHKRWFYFLKSYFIILTNSSSF